MDVTVVSYEKVLRGLPNCAVSIQAHPVKGKLKYALIIQVQLEGESRPLIMVIGRSMVIPLGTFTRYKNLQEVFDWFDTEEELIVFAKPIYPDQLAEFVSCWQRTLANMQMLFGVDTFADQFDYVTQEELITYGEKK